VSVDRDEQDAQRFWSAVLDALCSDASSTDPAMQPSASAAVDGEQLVEAWSCDGSERLARASVTR